MALCSVCPHPGGEKLTSRAMSLACFKPGERVMDLGCGHGESLHLLWKCGIDAVGLEIDPDCCDEKTVFCYDGKKLPFPDASFDGVLMECVLSCVEDRAGILRELRRVLKPEGTIALSDLTAKKDRSFSPASPLMGEEEYRTAFREAGFCIYYEEDASEGLLQMFGQLLLDGGEEAVKEAVGLTREERVRLKPGYHLWILVPDRYSELAKKTERLPFTTEKALEGSRPKLLEVTAKEIARIITVDTSGSTGKKKRIYFTDEDLQKTADFFTTGIAPMIGEGDRVTVFMRGSGLYSISGLLRVAVDRLGGTVIHRGDVGSIEDAAEAALQSDCLVMMPGDAAALAALHPELRPKSVLLSADYIPGSVVSRLEAAWNSRIFLHWGMTETGYGGAVTAEPGGAYLLRRDLFAEIIDPETGLRLPFGKTGEIVITTPDRKGMPLSRYRTGDRGKMLMDENGRPALTDLTGRLSDEILLPKGKRISIHLLDEILYREPDLVWYEAALTPEGALKIGWQGRPAADGSGPELPDRMERMIRAEYPELNMMFIPAVFRTGKRKLRIEDEDSSHL